MENMEKVVKHPTKLSPHLRLWLRNVSRFLINYECFQVQICQSSLLQTCVSARIWLCLSVCKFKPSGTSQSSSLRGFWLPWLEPTELQPSSSYRKSLSFPRAEEIKRQNKAFTRKFPSTQRREERRLSSSTVQTHFKSQNSLIFWNFWPDLDFNVSPIKMRVTHKQLCAWMSTHVRCD